MPPEFVRRADGIDVEQLRVERRQHFQERQAFVRLTATPGRWRAYARRDGGIEEVHVVAQVHRSPADRLDHLLRDGCVAALAKLGHGDEAIAEFAAELEHTRHHGRPAHADLERALGVDQALLRHVPEPGRGVVALDRIGIGVCASMCTMHRSGCFASARTWGSVTAPSPPIVTAIVPFDTTAEIAAWMAANDSSIRLAVTGTSPQSIRPSEAITSRLVRGS